MTAPTTYRSRTTRLVAGLAVIGAAILGASVLIILWVLGAASSDMDRAQNAGQTQLARAILKTYQDSVASEVADYVSWSELYDYLRGPRNPAFEDDSLGPYLKQTFGTDDVFIISRSGHVAYAYRAGRGATSEALARSMQQLAHSAFLAEDAGKRQMISGMISLDGVPAIVAASTILPPAIKVPSQFTLIEAQELHPAATAALGKEYGLSELKIGPANGPGIALMNPAQLPSGFTMSWASAENGRQLFHRVLPLILLIGIITALAFAAVAVSWWRFINDLKEGEQRVSAAELEAIRAQARAAEEMSRSKSAFIANMSHELRTPLNAIIGFSEVLQSGTFGPLPKGKYREYIGDILASGHHLLRLVNDILHLSKIDADKVEAKNEIVSLHDVIASSVRVVRVLAAKRNIRIRTHRDSTSPQVIADGDLLQQILLNLLSNAVKFSNEGQAVTIRCDHDREHCILQVTDQGCGIPAATLAQLGKPFVQAEGSFARKYQGTGLGLAISFRLAQMTGASLTIDSIEGAGTTATLTMRMAVREAIRAA
jgi:signal transduction histidine kinase/sensor domain CHASE-containing protein